MALNLDALKNLSGTPTHIDLPKQDTVSSPVQPPQHAFVEEKIAIPPSTQTKVSSTVPKISLMKLKQSNSGEVAPKRIENTPIVDDIPASVSEIYQDELVVDASKMENTISEEVQQTSPVDSVGTATPETIINTSEVQSIITEETIPEIQKTEENEIQEKKELFPNLQISHAMNLDEDFLDLGNIINLDAQEEQTISISPVKEKSEIKNISKEETSSADREDISNTDSVQEGVRETDVSPSIDVTPEYVAEVKTELSEGRRAGFRFFVKNNTKLIAGMGIVFSLSFIALFSKSFFGVETQHVGKTNIHEGIENRTPPVIEIETKVPPVIEPAGYEVGRDYSVTKNQKKNIRSKGLQQADSDTSTGTKTPTP